jgi:hypothetical protein
MRLATLCAFFDVLWFPEAAAAEQKLGGRPETGNTTRRIASMNSQAIPQTSSQPNYEELYHALNNRRGKELILLNQIAARVAGLMYTFQATDRLVADYAERQKKPPSSLDQHVHAFLWKLDTRSDLRRYKDAWITLKIMVQEGDSLKTMTEIYARAAQEVNAVPDRIERSVRAFRKAVEESNAAYYRENLAAFNESNASFCWNAARLLKQELQRPLSASEVLLPF